MDMVALAWVACQPAARQALSLLFFNLVAQFVGTSSDAPSGFRATLNGYSSLKSTAFDVLIGLGLPQGFINRGGNTSVQAQMVKYKEVL